MVNGDCNNKLIFLDSGHEYVVAKEADLQLKISIHMVYFIMDKPRL
jgi:hypothetical protein